MPKTETHEFKAEITQLLNIITHSIYTNKEIFLRELISNASDALDKVRYQMSAGTKVTHEELPLEIEISLNADKKLLTIRDTGIGMTMQELSDNIGTIAKSGSADFLEKISKEQNQANSIIGRFGVGFYSVFMVADKVTIQSRTSQPDGKPVTWESDGTGQYTIGELEKDLPRGTTIQVYLKDDAKEYAEPERISSIIKKHSNFIGFPIKVDDETVNTTPALWREPKFSVKKEQYIDFYKFISLDDEEPLETLHISVDAPVQFTSLLFIPPKSQDVFGVQTEEYGPDLHVRRVLIQHRCKDLLPEYLRFVQGVVDTEDLPLNISRETLQENILIRKISSTLTKQILSKLKTMAAEDKERYATFWKEHGKVFKLGYMDFANKDAYTELLRFNFSSHADAAEAASLDDYIDTMNKDQKTIYYASGQSREAIKLNPHMEIFRKKGIEVLFLLEPIDEFVLESLGTYKEKELKSIEQADISTLSSLEDKKRSTKENKEMSKKELSTFDKLLKTIKTILSDKITEVRVSERLEDSPSCLVSADGMSSQMEKYMKMMSKDESVPQKILEVNRDHPLMRNMLTIFTRDQADPFITDATMLLYETALLMDGYLPDPHGLVQRMNTLLEKSSGWYTEITTS